MIKQLKYHDLIKIIKTQNKCTKYVLRTKQNLEYYINCV